MKHDCLTDKYYEEFRLLARLVRPMLGLLLFRVGLAIFGGTGTAGGFFILIITCLLAILIQFRAFNPLLGPLLGRRFWGVLFLDLILGIFIDIIAGPQNHRRKLVRPGSFKGSHSPASIKPPGGKQSSPSAGSNFIIGR